MASTTFYLLAEPVWSAYSKDRDGEPELRTIKVARLTQSRPRKFNGALLKVTLRLPDGVFKPLAPEVVIDVPAEALEFDTDVKVEVPDRG